MKHGASGLATSGIVRDLSALLGRNGVLHDEEARPYEQGYRYGSGKSLCVARPASIEELSKVVRFSARQGLRIIAQGANTGLVGAATPNLRGDELVLSTERLNAVERLDPLERVAVAQAGVRLSAVNARAAEVGLFLPIDLAADPSIGGMAATNTGGARQIKYGDMRRRVLGLEVVLADGETLSGIDGLRKDNAGLDLKQLFIGAGGALGVITRVAVELAPILRHTATALVVPASLDAIPHLIAAAEANFGDRLLAFEGMSGSAMKAAIVHNPQLQDPFADGEFPDYALLIEVGASEASANLEDGLVDFLNAQAEHQNALVSDARFGAADRFWSLRHSISDGLRAKGRVLGLDVSVARAALPSFRQAAADLVRAEFPQFELYDFGHWGDGGLHLNVVCATDTRDQQFAATSADLRGALYDLLVNRFSGSFSAEHGLGPANLAFFHKYASPSEQRLSDGIKRLLDPTAVFGRTFLTSP